MTSYIAGKLCGFDLRIAGLLHTAEFSLEHSMIQENALFNALAMSNTLIDHAIAAFGLMGIDEVTEDAKTLFNWLKTRKTPSFIQSEITFVKP